MLQTSHLASPKASLVIDLKDDKLDVPDQFDDAPDEEVPLQLPQAEVVHPDGRVGIQLVLLQRFDEAVDRVFGRVALQRGTWCA